MRLSLRLLSLVALLFLMAPPPRVVAQGSDTRAAERQEIAKHKLTMDNVGKTAIAAGKLRELEKDPQFKAILVNKEEANSLNDVITKMDATPQIRSAVQSSGLTSREFMLTVMAVASTRSAAKLTAMGGDAAKAAGSLPTSPENLRFYAAHEAEIEKLAATIIDSEDDSEN